MAGNSEWNKAVKSAFKMGRKTNKKFSLKQAMFDAKKIYKKKQTMFIGNTTRKIKNNRRRRQRG